jgi:hypothetical protein
MDETDAAAYSDLSEESLSDRVPRMECRRPRHLSCQALLRFGVALTVTLFATDALAQNSSKPTYKLDASKSHVVAISNLAQQEEDCQPTRLVGKVVKRDFDGTVGTIVTGVTIEDSEGARTFANITLPENEDWVFEIGRVNAAWIVRGMQTLLKEGNRVSLGVFACGASGSVLVVNSIQGR